MRCVMGITDLLCRRKGGVEVVVVACRMNGQGMHGLGTGSWEGMCCVGGYEVWSWVWGKWNVD